MPAATAPRFFRMMPLAAAITLLGGCASGGTPKPPQAPELNTLYAHLDQASKGYETALQQAREGNTDASEKSLNDALDQMKDVSAHCGSTPGCDAQRVFSVYDRLLRLKDGSFFAGDDNDALGDQAPEGGIDGKTGAARSEERRVGKECRSRCDWSSDVCSSDLRLLRLKDGSFFAGDDNDALGDQAPEGGIDGKTGAA